MLVFDIGLMNDQPTSDTNIPQCTLAVNGRNALIYGYGNYLTYSRVTNTAMYNYGN